jgi:hemoglobin
MHVNAVFFQAGQRCVPKGFQAAAGIFWRSINTIWRVDMSLFNEIGGEGAVNAAVDIFYRKVLKDDRIKRFFEGVDMNKQAAKQKAFLTMAFGGPHNYSGADMRKGHAHLVAQGLNDTHFDAVMEHLGATLTELKVPGNLITQAAAIAESTRKDVLNK